MTTETKHTPAPAAAPERGPAVPAWLAILGLAVGVTLPLCGSVGAYAVMGWRVQALEARVTTDEVQLKAVESHTASQDVVLAEIKVEMKDVTKSVDGLGRQLTETNALIREVITHLPAQQHR